jgi:hypothetical protein
VNRTRVYRPYREEWLMIRRRGGQAGTGPAGRLSRCPPPRTSAGRSTSYMTRQPTNLQCDVALGRSALRRLALHRSGQADQNAVVKSFEGRLCDELFRSSPHARAVLEAWRQDCNAERPHSHLAWLTPQAYSPTRRTSSPQRDRPLLLSGGSAAGPVVSIINTVHPSRGSDSTWMKNGEHVIASVYGLDEENKKALRGSGGQT